MDIHNQIKKIIQKTSEGKIDWKSINPTAFRWTVMRGNNQFITTFQAVNIPLGQNALLVNPLNPIGNGTFVFTLQTTNPSEAIIQLQVSNNNNREYISELLQLYNLISEKTKKDYSKILDDLLDNL